MVELSVSRGCQGYSCTGFTVIATTYVLRFTKSQNLNGLSAAYVAMCLFSSELLKCRLLTWWLDHPMHAQTSGILGFGVRGRRLQIFGRRDGTVGNPHRAQISQFEFFELKFLNSSCSSLSSWDYTGAPCRAIRGKSSDSRQQYLSQQYPPPLLDLVPELNGSIWSGSAGSVRFLIPSWLSSEKGLVLLRYTLSYIISYYSTL